MLAAVAGDGFLGIEDHVADFSAGAVGTMEQMAADDDAAADAGTQGHEDHILTAGTAALPVFAQSGNIGIIACLHRETGEAGQGFGDVEYAPAQVDTLVDNTLAVNGAGNADAKAQNGFGCNIVISTSSQARPDDNGYSQAQGAYP